MLRRRTSLKAAVLRAALNDPRLAEPYRQLAQHYGTLVHPCRPGMPQHKGKAENGVHYVQRNLLAGEGELDLARANQAARVTMMWIGWPPLCPTRVARRREPTRMQVCHRVHPPSVGSREAASICQRLLGALLPLLLQLTGTRRLQERPRRTLPACVTPNPPTAPTAPRWYPIATAARNVTYDLYVVRVVHM